MKYNETIILKDGRECVLRNGTDEDGRALLDCFIQTHTETDFLLSYPDEITFTEEDEKKLIAAKNESPDDAEILAVVDGKVVGSAGIDRIGRCYKTVHRANFGISVIKDFWGLGIGRALTEACIRCARDAGYAQMELDVVASNKNAIALYESVGFKEYGRNPKGFRSRVTGMQELVLMRLDLED